MNIEPADFSPTTEKLRPFTLGYALAQFAHKSGRGRQSENYHHLYAKEALAKRLAKQDGPLLILSEDTTDAMRWEVDLSDLTPVVECAWPDGSSVFDKADYYARHGRYPRRIFDIGMIDKRKRIVGAFEIVFTHGVTTEKASDLYEAGVFCFTIPAARTDLPPSEHLTATNCFLSQPGSRRVRLASLNSCIKGTAP